MGKLKYEEAEKLLSSGVISQEAFDKMLESGYISKDKVPSKKAVMVDASGTKVTPSFIYKSIEKKGLGFRSKPTSKMTELSRRVNDLVKEYAEEWTQ